MKKIFAFAFAALTSLALLAATESNPTSGDKDNDVAGTSYTLPGTYVASAGSAQVDPMPDKGIKVRINKTAGDYSNALEFKVNESYIITDFQIIGVTNDKGKTATVGSIYVDGAAYNGTFDGTLPAKDASAASNIAISGIEAKESIIFVFSDLGGASQANICWNITYEEGTPSTDPKLSVSTAEVKLKATAAEPTDEAKLTFSGKNLAAGTYDLAIPSITGLTVNPTSVTVGEDGKLNQEITLSYAPEEDAAGFADLSLTIGELTAKTEIIYNATFEKRYLLFSLNIEQWVLDNGKRTNDFLMALGNAGWDYANVNELDSLNDSKSARNEPYLGLKLKTAGAYVAGWLRANETINLKFGYVGDDVIINGATIAKADLEQPIQLTVDQDTYIKIETTTKSTVVLKQLMLNDPIADVVLPDSPQGLNPAKAAVKAVKVIRDGQLLIEQNGQLYNAQGTIVK